jgi:hypothetical protein
VTSPAEVGQGAIVTYQESGIVTGVRVMTGCARNGHPQSGVLGIDLKRVTVPGETGDHMGLENFLLVARVAEMPRVHPHEIGEIGAVGVVANDA